MQKSSKKRNTSRHGSSYRLVCRSTPSSYRPFRVRCSRVSVVIPSSGQLPVLSIGPNDSLAARLANRENVASVTPVRLLIGFRFRLVPLSYAWPDQSTGIAPMRQRHLTARLTYRRAVGALGWVAGSRTILGHPGALFSLDVGHCAWIASHTLPSAGGPAERITGCRLLSCPPPAVRGEFGQIAPVIPTVPVVVALGGIVPSSSNRSARVVSHPLRPANRSRVAVDPLDTVRIAPA